MELPHGTDTWDWLLEEDEEQKFFWDLVREAPSRDRSSFAVAFRMLLYHMTVTQKKSSRKLNTVVHSNNHPHHLGYGCLYAQHHSMKSDLLCFLETLIAPR